jgi:hypothetical protein
MSFAQTTRSHRGMDQRMDQRMDPRMDPGTTHLHSLGSRDGMSRTDAPHSWASMQRGPFVDREHDYHHGDQDGDQDQDQDQDQDPNRDQDAYHTHPHQDLDKNPVQFDRSKSAKIVDRNRPWREFRNAFASLTLITGLIIWIQWTAPIHNFMDIITFLMIGPFSYCIAFVFYLFVLLGTRDPRQLYLVVYVAFTLAVIYPTYLIVTWMGSIGAAGTSIGIIITGVPIFALSGYFKQGLADFARLRRCNT